jgi:tripartite-type tricarboxylate transporter receptor subunit TctC
MPGAGTYKAANYLYGAAQHDGTVLGYISPTATTQELLGNPAVQFKTAKFGWIGRIDSFNQMTMTWHTSKVKTLVDAQMTESLIGATGVGAGTYIYPNVMNKALGAKFKIVSGYQGNGEVALAMERGEVEGMTTDLVTVKSKNWLIENKVNILVQYMAERQAQLPNVPSLVELARSVDEKQLLQLFANEGEIGRSILAPPGLPSGTLTALRRAFDSMAVDSEFIADSNKVQAELDPMPGEKLQKLIEAVAETPPAAIERARVLLK